MLTFCSR